MQRIKYIKHSETEYRSAEVFTSSKGATYRVFLYADRLEYRVKNVKSNYAIYNKKHQNKNLRALKRNAKRKLIELGVSFEMEVRNYEAAIPGNNSSNS